MQAVPPSFSHRERAIALGLLTPTELLPEEALATLRLAFKEMYNLFAKVDLNDARWSCWEPYLSTLEILERRLTHRLAKTRNFHTARVHTNLPDGIPEDEAQKFSSILEMTPAGEGCITSAFKEALQAAKAGTEDERELIRKARETERAAKATKGKKRKQRADTTAQRPGGGSAPTPP